MKWIKQPAALLLCLLAVTSLMLAGTGLMLKYTKGKTNPIVQDTMAIAVPFLYLRGEVMLMDDTVPPKGTGSDSVRKASALEQYVPLGPQGEIGREEVPLSVQPNPPEKQNPSQKAFHPVEEGYFDTALFIGDSRTEGLKLYGRLGKADYFANAGMSVFNLFDKTVSDNQFEEQGLYTLLSAKTYETIYLSLGINELGYPRASLEKQFAYVIEELRRLQPDAHLILMGNLGVTKEKAAKSEHLSLENVKAINALIASYADDKHIFYLDPNVLFADEEGYLRGEITGDGVHPYAKEYQNWAIWLKGYGI